MGGYTQGAHVISNDKGLSPSKNSVPQKSRNLFLQTRESKFLKFPKPKSKLLYFNPVLPDGCSSRSPQIIFMALATVFKITLTF